MSKDKIRNVHCTYFEGQTGLCQAKEFIKCNPVNCKLYTIDELSTILDLQEQLKHKEQECEELKEKLERQKDYTVTYKSYIYEEEKQLKKQLKCKEQECEKLKIQLMQKSEVDTFFNTPIEGWDNDSCKICEYKQNYQAKEQECEKLKTQILSLQTMEIEELKNYKQSLDEIERVADSNLCDGDRDVCSDDCLCDWKVVKDIINKAKDGE